VHEFERRISNQVFGGIFVERERHVLPESLIAGLCKRLTELGVSIRSGVEVVRPYRRGARITGVATSQGDISGENFIVAAGAWSSVLGRRFDYKIPVAAAKGYTVTAPKPALWPSRPLYLTEARVACSPFQDSLRIGGTLELSGLDPAIDARRVAAMHRAASKYLAGWEPGTPESVWAGLRPLTPDGLPVIGRVPGTDNLFIATGHGMLGMTLGPVTAIAIADLVAGRGFSYDIGAFDPARFSA
jgi:D-amino-acid dehydrogenase